MRKKNLLLLLLLEGLIENSTFYELNNLAVPHEKN